MTSGSLMVFCWGLSGCVGLFGSRLAADLVIDVSDF